MAQNVNPTFVKTPNMTTTQITTGVGSSLSAVTIYNGGVNGSKIVGVILTSNTSVTQDVKLSILSSASIAGFVNTVSVTLNAGSTSGVIPTNGFLNTPLPLDSDGNPYLILNSSAAALQATATTNSSQWVSGNFISLTVLAGDF